MERKGWLWQPTVAIVEAVGRSVGRVDGVGWRLGRGLVLRVTCTSSSTTTSTGTSTIRSISTIFFTMTGFCTCGHKHKERGCVRGREQYHARAVRVDKLEGWVLESGTR
eukprot:1895752-Rhodomonas_salina.3